MQRPEYWESDEKWEAYEKLSAENKLPLPGPLTGLQAAIARAREGAVPTEKDLMALIDYENRRWSAFKAALYLQGDKQ